MRQYFDTIFGSIIVLLLLGVSVLLFFPDLVRFGGETTNTEGSILVAMSTPVVSFDPASYEASSRTVLMNVYESLVRPNKFLQVEPQLAVSWGILDDKKTWVFKLRENVRFHNGSIFTAHDVVESFRHAMNSKTSQVKTLLKNIARVKKIDNHTLHIETFTPDPVLPRKISTVLIFPHTETNPEKALNGTGPFKLKHDGNLFVLNRNNRYWGSSPHFKQVTIQIVEDKFERLKRFKAGLIDVLLNVPSDREKELRDAGATVIAKPGLTVNYLMFNHEHPLFADRTARESINRVINKKELAELASGFITPVSQFVPLGILGYNPELPEITWNKPEAQRLMKTVESFEKGMEITLDIADELQLFTSYLQEYFAKVGIRIIPNLISNDALAAKIAKGESDLYFSGWRFELGDSGDFLGEVVASTGASNGTKYNNEEVNRLIRESSEELDPTIRAKMLREIAKLITQDDFFGVPLVETRVLYAMQPNLSWEPRLDGYFLAHDVTPN